MRVSTLQLKAELSKHSQRVQALTQRLETLERRPSARTMTRKESMAPGASMTRAPSTALPSAGASSPSPRPGTEASLPAGTLVGATADSATADSTSAVAAPGKASQMPSSPSVNLATNSKSVEEAASTPSVSDVKGANKHRPLLPKSSLSEALLSVAATRRRSSSQSLPA